MKMVTSSHSGLVLLSALILAINHLACATDPDMLQDYCPAISDDEYGHQNMVAVNGRFCQDPKKVTSGDFTCSGFRVISDPTNTISTRYTIDSCPSLNTLGVSGTVTRLGPYGFVKPHLHPGASELVICELGRVFVVFVSSSSHNNKVFYAYLKRGQAFTFPRGLPHALFNVANKPAKIFAAFSSQNPRVVPLDQSASLFSIDFESLAKEFSLDKKTVQRMKKNLIGLKA